MHFHRKWTGRMRFCGYQSGGLQSQVGDIGSPCLLFWISLGLPDAADHPVLCVQSWRHKTTCTHSSHSSILCGKWSSICGMLASVLVHPSHKTRCKSAAPMVLESASTLFLFWLPFLTVNCCPVWHVTDNSSPFVRTQKAHHWLRTMNFLDRTSSQGAQHAEARSLTGIVDRTSYIRICHWAKNVFLFKVQRHLSVLIHEMWKTTHLLLAQVCL